ncbi:MAG: enoyl-CoA hydratase-related protein, partial [Burkholderiales bacterium]
MQSDSVRIEQQGAVTIVTLDRADVRNAVDADTARRLHAAFVAFDEDPDARVAVFHGANGHFCAGWDLQFGARVAQQPGGAGVLADLDFDAADARALAPMGPSRLLLD